MSYTENMLYMMDAMSEGEGYKPDRRLAKALDILFILHADVHDPSLCVKLRCEA